jgi:hypothetical protein
VPRFEAAQTSRLRSTGNPGSCGSPVIYNQDASSPVPPKKESAVALADDIRAYFATLPAANVGGKGDKGEVKMTIAEQKSFLSKKKVEYAAKFAVDEGARTVRFFEMLKESGSGMSAGDGDIGGGWGVSKETYKTGFGGREGNIEQQGSMLGKKFAFTFDYGRIRNDVRSIAEQNGYELAYQITPKGM